MNRTLRRLPQRKQRHAWLLVALLAFSFAPTGCTSFDEHLRALHTKEAPDETTQDEKTNRGRPPSQTERIDAALALKSYAELRDPQLQARKQEAIEALRATLSDPSALVRQVAIEALAAVAGTEGAGAIADRLRDQDPWVRFTAADKLGDLRAATARESLEVALLEDTDDEVRAQAAFALTAIGSTASLPPLHLGLGDPSPAVADACRRGLETITGAQLGADPRSWREQVKAAQNDAAANATTPKSKSGRNSSAAEAPASSPRSTKTD